MKWFSLIARRIHTLHLAACVHVCLVRVVYVVHQDMFAKEGVSVLLSVLTVISLKKTHATCRLVANTCVLQSLPRSCSFQIQSVKQGGVVCQFAESVVGCREAFSAS